LDLDPSRTEDGPVRLATALAGGRAATELDRLDAAILFYSVAIEIEPQHRGALEARGRLLFERGDLDGARDTTETLLGLAAEHSNAAADPVEQAGWLTRLGAIAELRGEDDAALRHFSLALRVSPSDAAAHAGGARLLLKSGREQECVAALRTWADAATLAGDSASAGERMLQAAELELVADRLAQAEQYLETSIGTFPGNARAWVLLAEILFEADRVDALLQLVPAAVTHDEVAAVDDAVARLAVLYGHALVRRDHRVLACEAFALALELDARCAEAALEHARLLRGRGAWSEAAGVLQTFCERHPGPGQRDVAEVHCKLADLMAGPLEDVEGAIGCYERALEIWPEHPRARAPLATLLGHLPDRSADAIRHHAALLEAEPTRAASLRAVANIACQRGLHDEQRLGLAVLRALGAASPLERQQAPNEVHIAAAAEMLSDPLFEAVRRMLQLASETLGPVLAEVSDEGPNDAAEGDIGRGRFGDAMAAAIGDIAAPGLESLDLPVLGDLLYRIAAVACGDESETSVDASGEISASLQRALGRWTRRKIRRVLDALSPEDVRALDVELWRIELLGLAAERALESFGGDLRAALESMSRRSDSDGAISETDDLCALLAADPVARALLWRIERAWCGKLLES
jgi:tetratricopeptide (TPR) repeat protein